MSGLSFLGGVSVGGMIPGAAAAIDLAVPDLQARIDALAAFSPGEISLATQLSLAQQMVADLQAAIALGITPPSIAAQIAIIGGFLDSLRANLSAIAVVTGAFASAGAYMYAWDGRADGFGPALTTELAGGLPDGTGASHCNALVLATSVGATWTSMGLVFKVS